MLTQVVDNQQFNRYKEALGGLTEENEGTVRQKLIDLGVLQGDIQMQGVSDAEEMDV